MASSTCDAGDKGAAGVANVDVQELAQQVGQVNAARATMFRTLASLFYQEPTAEQVRAMRTAAVDAGGLPQAQRQALRLMQRGLRGPLAKARQDVACDYAHTFLAAGEYEDHRAVPYESVFTSEHGLLMQEARDQVRKDYLKHHVEVRTKGFEPEDHVSFEMDFLAALADQCDQAVREGDVEKAHALCADALAFERAHLLNWIDDLCDAVDANAQTDFYKGVAALARSYAHDDEAVLCDLEAVLADAAGIPSATSAAAAGGAQREAVGA